MGMTRDHYTTVLLNVSFGHGFPFNIPFKKSLDSGDDIENMWYVNGFQQYPEVNYGHHFKSTQFLRRAAIHSMSFKMSVRSVLNSI